METFDELQNLWNQQAKPQKSIQASEIIKKAEAQMRNIKINHFFTIAILSFTMAVLVWYFVWVSAYKISLMSFGLGLMIGSLVVRVALELVSVQKLKAIKLDSDMSEFSKKMEVFYGWRKKLHFILTPIIYLSYVVGFVVLLPVFKEKLSWGFYLYILISGILFLSIFGFFLTRFLKKELQILHHLKNIG